MHHEEQVSHQSNGEVFITLLRRAEEGCEWQWFVQVTEGDESVEEDFLDDHKARAFYRMICAHNGIKVDYEAPTFALDFTQAPSAELSAAETYHKARAEMGSLSPGTPEALAVRDRWMDDPQIVRWSREILSLAEGGDGWIVASIRTVCRRIEARQKAEEKTESDRMMTEVEGFGEF